MSDTEEEEEDGSNSSDDFADDPYAHLQRRAAHHGHHNAGVRTGFASRFGAAVLDREEDDAEGGSAKEQTASKREIGIRRLIRK